MSKFPHILSRLIESATAEGLTPDDGNALALYRVYRAIEKFPTTDHREAYLRKFGYAIAWKQLKGKEVVKTPEGVFIRYSYPRPPRQYAPYIFITNKQN